MCIRFARLERALCRPRRCNSTCNPRGRVRMDRHLVILAQFEPRGLEIVCGPNLTCCRPTLHSPFFAQRGSPVAGERRGPRLRLRNPRGARLPARRDAPARGRGAQSGGRAQEARAREREDEVRLLPRLGELLREETRPPPVTPSPNFSFATIFACVCLCSVSSSWARRSRVASPW